MTAAQDGVRALGKALRLKIRADDDVPAAMQAALLRLATLPELVEGCPRSKAKIEMTEQADGNERQAKEARLAG